MSRIFGALAILTTLFIGVAAIDAASQGADAGSNPGLQDSLAELFATGIDVTVLVPFVLMIALLLASLAVMAR